MSVKSTFTILCAFNDLLFLGALAYTVHSVVGVLLFDVLSAVMKVMSRKEIIDLQRAAFINNTH